MSWFSFPESAGRYGFTTPRGSAGQRFDKLRYVVYDGRMNLDLALKALDNPHRRTVMSAMRDPGAHFTPADGIDPVADGVCVLQISAMLGVNQSTASTYMSMLRDAGLVRAVRVGKYTLYKRDDEAVAAVASAILREL
jgi:ArsR family transcriptional regulator